MENNKIFWRKVPSVTNLLLCGMFIPVGILHASESYGQRVMIDLTAENMTVKEVLEQIESQSDFDFFYNNAHVDLTYIIHSGFISGYQNRYGDNLKPPTNVYHRMTA